MTNSTRTFFAFASRLVFLVGRFFRDHHSLDLESRISYLDAGSLYLALPQSFHTTTSCEDDAETTNLTSERTFCIARAQVPTRHKDRR